MAKTSRFRRFMTALKRHWKTALPQVTLVSDPPTPLGRDTFSAGSIPQSGQQVYLEFQTTWKEAGYFTINLIVVDRGSKPSLMTVSQNAKPGEKLQHGGHRIGHFVGDGRADKWWHLFEVEDRVGLGGDPHFWRELRLSLREGNWTAPSYDDEIQVINAAVDDVTQDVQCALRAIGATRCD